MDAAADGEVVAGKNSAEVDPAYLWTIWKDLSRAIELQKLDGPEDIVEKADIIRDRIDDLTGERQRLATLLEEWADRHESLDIQLEVLEDLAMVQLDGDLQLQQHAQHTRATQHGDGSQEGARRIDARTRRGGRQVGGHGTGLQAKVE